MSAAGRPSLSRAEISRTSGGMAPAPVLAFAGLALADWGAVAAQARRLEYVAKPGALAALVAWAVFDGGSTWLVAALVLSLVGDVFLMLPGDRFVPGLAAFLLAHLAYVAALPAPAGARFGWFVVALAVTAPLGLRILRAAEPDLRGAIAAYMAAIALMVASAVASGIRIAALGAILFLVSDTLIAWDRFVRPRAWSAVAIIVTYHLGQLGLVVGLLSR